MVGDEKHDCDCRKLLLGQPVEVLQRAKDLRGCWQPATIVLVKNGRREVEYANLFTNNGVSKLRESFSVMMDAKFGLRQKVGRKVLGFLRPYPVENPKLDLRDWHKGLFVDHLSDGAWWEGVLVEDITIPVTCAKLMLPDHADKVLTVSVLNLRLSQEWDEVTGQWSVRGYWKRFSSIGEGRPTSFEETGISNSKRSNCRKSAPNLSHHILKEFRLSAKETLRLAGWTIEFHQPLNKSREPVYVSPSGRRFYSLTRACSFWRKQNNMPCRGKMEPLNIYNLTESTPCLKMATDEDDNLGMLVSCNRSGRTKGLRSLGFGTGSLLINNRCISGKGPRRGCKEHNSRKRALDPSSFISDIQHVSSLLHATPESESEACKSPFCTTDIDCSSFASAAMLGVEKQLVSSGDPIRKLCVEETCGMDDICGACGEGGELLLCDQCPSAYHIECVGLEAIPEGNWYCSRCCCMACKMCVKDGGSNGMLNCSQCEKKYHSTCSPKQVRANDGCWFCTDICEKIFDGIYHIIEICQPIEEGLSWVLLKGTSRASNSISTVRLLAGAQAVLHECFLPMIDHVTGTDILSQVVHSKRSNFPRLNCIGFYTLILVKEDEFVSVATIRVHGSMLAEIPLIGTRLLRRRQGMCRHLMHVLEKLLNSVGVTKLILPAVPQLLSMWRVKFGFQFLDSVDQKEIIAVNLMRFPGTMLLKKVLSNPRGNGQCHHASSDECGNKRHLFMNLQVGNPSNVSEENCHGILSWNSTRLHYPSSISRLKRRKLDDSTDDAKAIVATTGSRHLVESNRWAAESIDSISKQKNQRKMEQQRLLSKDWVKEANASSPASDLNDGKCALKITIPYKRMPPGLLERITSVLMQPCDQKSPSGLLGSVTELSASSMTFT